MAAGVRILTTNDFVGSFFPDLHDDGRVELRLVEVGAARPWTGAGAAAQAALEAETVGHVPGPLRQAPGRERWLGEAIAGGLLRCDERLDCACVVPGVLWTQPARDGVGAQLAAGPVSLAGRRRGGTLALSPRAAAAALSAADSHPIEATWRDGLMEAVSR